MPIVKISTLRKIIKKKFNSWNPVSLIKVMISFKRMRDFSGVNNNVTLWLQPRVSKVWVKTLAGELRSHMSVTKKLEAIS